MKKGTLTREHAIAIVGAEAVTTVDRENYEFTNRVGYNGACQGDAAVEFSASVKAVDREGRSVHLIAYCYQDAVAVDNGLDSLDWTAEGYEVI